MSTSIAPPLLTRGYQIFNGNNLIEVEKLPENSISCIVTSPPYYGSVRDYAIPPSIYGDAVCEHQWKEMTRKVEKRTIITAICSKCNAWHGVLGDEETPSQYVHNLCLLFRKIKDKLREDGSLWINLGDIHINNSLCGVPSLFMTEMLKDGWQCNDLIIWKKPNPPVSSSRKHFTMDYEFLFWFGKKNPPTYWVNHKTKCVTREKPKTDIENHDHISIPCRKCHGDGCAKCHHKGWRKKSMWEVFTYYFEQQLEPLKSKTAVSKNATNKHQGYARGTYSGFDYHAELLRGRNMRCVWEIAVARSKFKHYAVFPKQLVKIPIIATTPPKICTKCGLPQILTFKWTTTFIKGKKYTKNEPDGYAKCDCNAEFVAGIVCDPFMGTGTTGVVAKEQKRQFFGIDQNRDYVAEAKQQLYDKQHMHADYFEKLTRKTV